MWLIIELNFYSFFNRKAKKYELEAISFMKEAVDAWVWSGESISHNPVYSVVVGATEITSDDGESESTVPTSTDGIISGFELLVLTAVIPIVVYITRKRK